MSFTSKWKFRGGLAFGTILFLALPACGDESTDDSETSTSVVAPAESAVLAETTVGRPDPDGFQFVSIIPTAFSQQVGSNGNVTVDVAYINAPNDFVYANASLSEVSDSAGNNGMALNDSGTPPSPTGGSVSIAYVCNSVGTATYRLRFTSQETATAVVADYTVTLVCG